MDIASALPQQTTGSGASNSLSQLSEDYTRFLTLLTAQIANQDPLAPMDSSQFVTQLAQLSQVEQSVKVNGNLEIIQEKLTNFSTLAGANLLGHSVTVMSSSAELTNGVSNTSYRLAAPASNVTAVITDQDGNIVRTITDLPSEVDTITQLDWDGLDDDGQDVPDGIFEIEITATSEDGSDIPTLVFQEVNVEEIILDFGQQYLSLSNGEQVPLLNILAVS